MSWSAYKHTTLGERNAVEQWHSPLKHRLKRFRFTAQTPLLNAGVYVMWFFLKYRGSYFDNVQKIKPKF